MDGLAGNQKKENNIPIIEVDSIKFIMKYIKLNNVKRRKTNCLIS